MTSDSQRPNNQEFLKSPGGIPSVTAGAPVRKSLQNHLLLAAVLLLIFVVLLRGISIGEFDFNVDEAQQAVTGLYFADLVKDMPVKHPIDYTNRYYAKYPALALIHWPPFFHFSEGMMFLVFGRSVVTARLTVVFFTLLGCFFWYRLVDELSNKWTAAASTLLIAFLPFLLVYEKVVMLEAPALSLCIAASYFWTRYLKDQKGRSLAWFVLFASMALLTKQHSVYLAMFCLLSLAATKSWKLLWTANMVKAFLACAVLVGPYYALAFLTHKSTILRDAFHVTSSGITQVPLGRFTYYWTILPEQLGLILLSLSVIGLLTSRWWSKDRAVHLMLAWILACYVAMTLMAGREARQILYWIPPFVFFAVAPLTAKPWPRWSRAIAAGVVLGLVGTSTASAWTYQRPYIAGYAEAAQYICKNSGPGVVLMDGDVPGNFVFFMRAYDPNRHFVVMRKALYASQIMLGYGSVELVRTQSGIQDLLSEYGIEYIVVLREESYHFGVQRVLREMLNTPQFSLVKAIPIETNQPDWRGRQMLVYRNLKAAPPTAQKIRIRMLTLNRDIEVSLQELGIQ